MIGMLRVENGLYALLLVNKSRILRLNRRIGDRQILFDRTREDTTYFEGRRKNSRGCFCRLDGAVPQQTEALGRC